MKNIKKKKCPTCKPHWQDERYGKNIRVHNQAGTKQTIKWRCTVCGDTKAE